jgi:hypothetical protein
MLPHIALLGQPSLGDRLGAKKQAGRAGTYRTSVKVSNFDGGKAIVVNTASQAFISARETKEEDR